MVDSDESDIHDGTRRGLSMLAIVPLQWDDDGWPVVGA